MRLRQENHLNLEGRGCSELILHHHSPAWATKQDTVKKEKAGGSGGHTEPGTREGNEEMRTPSEDRAMEEWGGEGEARWVPQRRKTCRSRQSARPGRVESGLGF